MYSFNLSIVSYLDITFACNGIINDLPITSALLSVVLFVMFLLMKMKQNTLSTLGSKYSLNLYIYHPLLGGILSFILLRLGVPGGGIWITICMAVNIAFRGLFVDNIYFNAIYYNKSKII